ncbi:MAG: hypothetical protein D6797_07615 [Bdellovibrio sp.]|nr:MAG: hypothetical protein D6797_07615 [Bdellovibrio sp.]
MSMEMGLSKSSFVIPFQFVQAGAGAGKTTELTKTVLETALSFYQAHQRWPYMVVTTFTRKATQELKERLAVSVFQDEIYRDYKENLLYFLTSGSYLHISTIHGILSSFLRQNAFDFGLDPKFTILTSSEAFFLSKKILKEILEQRTHLQDLMKNRSFSELVDVVRAYSCIKRQYPDAQKEDEAYYQQSVQTFMEHLQTSLLGAAQLISEKLERKKAKKPEEKRAVEMWLRYRSSLLDSVKKIQSAAPSSLEQICYELREKYQTLKDELPAYKRLLMNKEHPTVVADKDLQKVAPYFKRFWEKYKVEQEKLSELGDLFKEQFQKFKNLKGVLEMEDLELLSLDLIRKHPDVAMSFSRKWDFWLVDEYQDTSPLQVDLLRQLAGDRPEFIVGDPQQSIYLFRGARSEVFFKKKEEMEAKTQPRFLMTNYRSHPELLNFFNTYFPQLDPQFGTMKISEKNFDEAKYVGIKLLVGNNIEDRKQNEATSDTLGVVSHILSLRQKGVRWEEICVLSRYHKDLALLSETLTAYHIPVQLHSNKGFYDQREIVDALALLKFLVNPSDNENLMVLLRSPWVKVKDQDLACWVEEFRSEDLTQDYWTFFKQKKHPSIKRLEELQQLLGEEGVSGVFERALVELGFFDLSLKHDSTGKRESNLWKLLVHLNDEQKKPGFNFLKFAELEKGRLMGVENDDEEQEAVAALEPNRVNLMTIHASKGLAFEHVIVYAAEQIFLKQKGQRRKPSVVYMDGYWSMKIPFFLRGKGWDSIKPQRMEQFFENIQQREEEEKKRLLYVAMTRARHSVCLSFALNGKKKSGADEGYRFIDFFKLEAGKHCHSEPSFCYEVEKGPWKPEPFKEKVKEESFKWPQPWSILEREQQEKVSVSELLEDSEKTTALKERFELLKKPAEGVLFHRFMERLRYESLENILPDVRNHFPDRYQEMTEALQYVLHHTEIPMEKLLKKGFVEWGFQYIKEGRILEGQIDLWGEVDGKTWVVDYKSGTPSMKEKAFQQLQLYAEALRSRGVGYPIYRAVIYPFLKLTEVREMEDS